MTEAYIKKSDLIEFLKQKEIIHKGNVDSGLGIYGNYYWAIWNDFPNIVRDLMQIKEYRIVKG